MTTWIIYDDLKGIQVVRTDNKNSICYSDSDIKTTIITGLKKL